MNRREILRWHRDERASLVRQIESLASGQLSSWQEVDGVIIDTSDRAIADLRRRLASLDEFLGAGTEPAK